MGWGPGGSEGRRGGRTGICLAKQIGCSSKLSLIIAVFLGQALYLNSFRKRSEFFVLSAWS